MKKTIPEKGSALVVVMLVLVLLTLLGSAAVEMAQNDLEQGRIQVQQLRTTYLAESGIELAIGWFSRPEQFAGGMHQSPTACRSATTAAELFIKRCRRNVGIGGGRAGFSTDGGASQFQGTRERPDGLVTVPAEWLLPEVENVSAGATVEVRLFRPKTAGAVCTIESTARTTGGATQIIQMELYEVMTPVLTAAAGAGTAESSAGPVRVHWGALRYADDGPNDQESWLYRELKRLARRYGRYYTTDGQGRLYRDGVGSPLMVDELFSDDGAASGVSPVIFIDTLDGQPPRSGVNSNLATLTLHGPTHDLVAYIGGHLVVSPSGGRQTRMVPSPVADAGMVELTDLTFSGGFYIAGQLTVEQESRLFGAVYAAEGFDGAQPLEVWYDSLLGRGTIPGWPVVAPLPGSWQMVSS